MKNLFSLALLVIVPVACTPDIPHNPPPTQVTALFDPAANPPVVPVPTDLALNPQTGLLSIPSGPNASPAELEFDAYLDTLNGFPNDTPGGTTFNGPLNPGTVNSNTVRVLDLTAGAGVPNATIAYTDLPSTGGGQISVTPPFGGWLTGHQYAVAIIGGPNGMKGAQGQSVVGAPAWALLSATNSLVTCAVLTDPTCRATTDIIPSDQTDPALRIQDQTAKALQLEAVRRAFVPIIGGLVAQGVNRQDIALLWTFTITSRPVATFDPANNVVPFPNNLVLALSPDGGSPHVNLPIPDAGTLVTQLIAGLNTLDGFSTTGPMVSVNQDYTSQQPLPAISLGQIDPATLGAGTGILKVSTAIPAGGGQTSPGIVPCLDCVSSLLSDGGVPNNPQQLQLLPAHPLDERTTYVAYMTDSLKDTNGKPIASTSAFAFLRSANPLLTAAGKSAVSVVSDAQAQLLEPARLVMKPGLDAIEAAGIPRAHVVLAWVFTTQTEITALRQIHAAAAASAVPPNPVALLQNTHGTFYRGEFLVPFLLTGPSGTINPASTATQKLEFYLLAPSMSPPPAGFPVTIFSHDITRARTDVSVFATALTSHGQAVIAIDLPFHGNRTTCLGSSAVTGMTDAGDGFACTDIVNQVCDPTSGHCIKPGYGAPCDSVSTGGKPGDIYCEDRPTTANPPGGGACITPDGGTPVCEGGKLATACGDFFGTPLISGWNILNLNNLFTTRDNFRQVVADLTQLVKMISATTADSAGNASLNDQLGSFSNPNPFLDPSHINFAGQGLGSILGTLYASVSPEVHNVVLDVASSDPASILLLATDPTFVGFRSLFFATLHSQGIDQGTKSFDQFVGIAKWILDPADPLNFVYYATNPLPPLPADRTVLIQYITFDPVVANPTTVELINAANRPGGTQASVCLYDPALCTSQTTCSSNTRPASVTFHVTADPHCSVPTNGPSPRHGVLLSGSSFPGFSPTWSDTTTTTKVQTQVQTFINGGTISCP